jgi:hypothetical protein
VAVALLDLLGQREVVEVIGVVRAADQRGQVHRPVIGVAEAG